MKILVMGATGMAGSTISLYLTEQGYDVVSFSTRPVKHYENIVGDALNSELVKKTIKNGGYDYVINCIGVLNQSAEANHAVATYLNSYLPHQIANIIQDMPTKLIHMSTDCVFSGKTGGYKETDFPDGSTFYDRSKALGEVVDEKNLTFRNSIIGPDTNENGIGLFNWFMKQKGNVFGYTGAIWTGVTTLTLAKAMEQAMKENLTGLYHLVNNETISKYELLHLFNKYFKDSKLNIAPKDVVTADKSLINTRSDFTFTVPSYELMIQEMKNWITAHAELYPHYYQDER